MKYHHPVRTTGLALLGVLLPLSMPSVGTAAGFEVGENTPRSTARGGTGVVTTADPSTVYFNPARLSHADDYQLLLSSNLLDLNVEFQRDDFYAEPGGSPDRTFEPATNQGGLFPAPFMTASFDVGPAPLTIGAGLFGPPAYGNPCWGEMDGGDCQLDPTGPTRGMVVEADMIVAYGAVAAGYAFEFEGDRRLDIGLTAMAAHQRTDFSVVVEADQQVSPPWEEDPEAEAFVQGRELTDWAPTGILGISYSDGPLRLAASYRPPIRWETTGTVEVDLPDTQTFRTADPALSDDTMHLHSWQAGSLRLGWGLQWGEHPADAQRPRWDLEFNTIWENWSVVDHFRIDVDGSIEARAFPDEDGEYPAIMEFEPMYQHKGYRDTISLRTGLSYGVNSWLTAHGGAFLETAAQPVAYTAPDFISWERYAASVGASFYLPHQLELDLGYTFIHSPSRTVEKGEVYNAIPMSNCRGPDYRDSACEQEGTPPGNPQNEGHWQAHFHIVSAGVTWTY